MKRESRFVRLLKEDLADTHEEMAVWHDVEGSGRGNPWGAKNRAREAAEAHRMAARALRRGHPAAPQLSRKAMLMSRKIGGPPPARYVKENKSPWYFPPETYAQKRKRFDDSAEWHHKQYLKAADLESYYNDRHRETIENTPQMKGKIKHFFRRRKMARMLKIMHRDAREEYKFGSEKADELGRQATKATKDFDDLRSGR